MPPSLSQSSNNGAAVIKTKDYLTELVRHPCAALNEPRIISTLINASGNRQQQSSSDCSQAEDVTRCHGTLCFPPALFTARPPSTFFLFLCWSAASWLIAVVIIRSGIVPQALPNSSHLTQRHCSSDVGVRCLMTTCAELVWDLESRFHVHFFRNMLVLCLKGRIQHVVVVVCKLYD